jgi:hypothetical protein
MKQTMWLASCAMGMAAALFGQGRGAHMGGGRMGGFSREGPAAGGGFSSAREHQASAQASRQTPSSMQASRQQYASGAQANREQTATGMQASREQTATGMQSSAQVYHGSYTHTVTAYPAYPAWDAGRAAVAGVTGAAIGAAAASSASHSAPVYVASPACAAPIEVPVGSMTYFRCGSYWYTQGYGPNGPTYVQVAPPPGF